MVEQNFLRPHKNTLSRTPRMIAFFYHIRIFCSNSQQSYVEIREIDPLSVIVPISKIRKPHLPIGLNISNTLYRADVPSKKWFRIVFREDQPSTKEQPEGAREPE